MKSLLLDTNALILLSDPTHPLFGKIEKALAKGAKAMTSAVAWHEYVRGPLSSEDQQRARFILEERILPLDRDDAEVAAMLFNRSGRRRGSTADCLIGAVALRRDATLVTVNVQDFKPFGEVGLRLLS